MKHLLAVRGLRNEVLDVHAFPFATGFFDAIRPACRLKHAWRDCFRNHNVLDCILTREAMVRSARGLLRRCLASWRAFQDLRLPHTICEADVLLCVRRMLLALRFLGFPFRCLLSDRVHVGLNTGRLRHDRIPIGFGTGCCAKESELLVRIVWIDPRLVAILKGHMEACGLGAIHDAGVPSSRRVLAALIKPDAHPPSHELMHGRRQARTPAGSAPRRARGPIVFSAAVFPDAIDTFHGLVTSEADGRPRRGPGQASVLALRIQALILVLTIVLLAYCG